MPPKASKNSSAGPTSPRKTRSGGRKRARSSLDATIAPPTKKLVLEDEESNSEGEDEDKGAEPTGVKGKTAKVNK